MGQNGAIKDRIKSLRRVRVSELQVHPKNWRKHPEGQRRAMSAALSEIGFADALLVRETPDGLQIIDGHLRADLAKDQKVPVLVLDVDEQEADKLLATFDAITGLAEIDEELLRSLTDGLEFETPELDELVAGLLSDEPAEITDDVPPEAQHGPCVAQLGDVWRCGRHRVVCGDATDGALYAHDANAVLTDPPYGIGYEYASHDDSREQWFGLMDSVVPLMQAAAAIVVMPCCGIDRLDWWYANHRPDWLMAWYKGSPGHRSHVGFNDWEAHLVWGKPPKQMHDYFQTACGFEIEGHPCPKPVAWAAWLCERICEHGGTILDPFLGSGTTLIAAEQLGRTCYGIEIEPKYVDVILQRYMNFTNVSPRRKSDGALFSELVKGEPTYV